MKTLLTIGLSTLLAASLANAKDKDFSASFSNIENLKAGQNQIQVQLKSKTNIINDAQVKLRVSKDGATNFYKAFKKSKNSDYTFNLDFPQAGKYNYILSFSKMGGIVHKRKGAFEVSSY